MAAWLNSIESLIRAVTTLSWLGIGFAVLAAVCGFAALYLNRQAAELWQQRLAQDVTAAAAQVRESQEQEKTELEQQLQEMRELLLASEERSEGFLDRIESLQQELAGTRRSSRPKPASRPTPPPTAPPRATPVPDEDREKASLTPNQVTAIRSSLAGKPSGEVTIVTIVGQPRSAQLGQELRAVLEDLGWQVTVIQGVFPTPPKESTFVFHSRDSIPEEATPLSVALAMAGLMSLPSKVTVNPARPAGFLGLIVVPSS